MSALFETTTFRIGWHRCPRDRRYGATAGRWIAVLPVAGPDNSRVGLWVRVGSRALSIVRFP